MPLRSLLVAFEVLYSEEADQSLTALEATAPGNCVRLTAVLTDFEADPPDSRWRRRRYSNPPVFGFTVRTSGEVYLVPWSSIADTAIIEYVGPDI